MKKVLFSIGAVATIIAFSFLSCSKKKESATALSSQTTTASKMDLEAPDFNRTLQQNLATVLDNQSDLLIKIAESGISYEAFAQLNTKTNPEYNAILQNMKRAGDNLNTLFNSYKIETCSDCAVMTDEKTLKSWKVIEWIRADKEGFVKEYGHFRNIVLDDAANASPSTGGTAVPNGAAGCRFSFYVCLAVCAAAAETGPVAAAGVYLCACGYCSYPPPGC